MHATPPFVYTTVQGNDNLAQRLLHNSGVELLLNTNVTNVASIQNNGFLVGFNGTTRHFDALILATPIERAHGMVLDHAIPKRKFVELFVNVATAQTLNSSFFGLDQISAESFLLAPSTSSAVDGIHLIWNVGNSGAASV